MPLPLSPWYPVKAAVLVAAMMTVVAATRRTHHPFPRFGPANQITTVRALLVALLAAFIGEAPAAATAGAAVGIGIGAASLDGVDGWLARRTKMTSDFGARFDMEVDALLIQVLAILVWLYGRAGSWVLASGLLRYLFVTAGWVWPWMQAPLPVSFRRKAICHMQIASLLVALAPIVDPQVSTLAAAAGLAVLSYSFLVDTMWLWAHR